MPLRFVLIAAGLFIACLAVAIVAWMVGSEFYILAPSYRHMIHRPPTHPIAVVLLFVFIAALYLYSEHYALVFFSCVLGGLALGSLVGFAVFSWTPTWAQWALTAVMSVETVYCWNNRCYFDY